MNNKTYEFDYDEIVTSAGTVAGRIVSYDIVFSDQGPQGPQGPQGIQGPQGLGVTSVIGTAPVVSSGGATPTISISAATTSAAGSMSSADKTKLDGVASGAEVNVNADWNAASGDAQILNKPVLHGLGPSFTSINWQAGAHWAGTLSFNTIIAFQDVVVGKTITVEITGYAQFGVNWPSGITWLSGSAPSITDGATTYFRILATSGSTFLGEAFNPMTAQDKTKLNGIATGAEVNVNADWTASSGDAVILNKPATFPPTLTGLPVELVVACSDETNNLTVGANKVTFRAPFAFTLTAVRASVNTAPTGSTLVVDINENGTSVLSTKLSIDANEKTSTTAASAAVISDSAIANDVEITIDIDQVGSTIAGKGLKIVLIGTRA